MLKHLERRGALYIQPLNYSTLVAFLTGYDMAIVSSGEPGFLSRFKEWIDKRVGHHCSLHWSAVIRDVFAGGDSDRAMSVLHQMFGEFMRELENGAEP